MSAAISASCRVLPYAVASGPANMALDEALLESVAADPQYAVVRTYGWVPPTLSLGYFQSVAELEREPRWEGVPLVRRSTGGGALWHHHEVTYALVIPEHHRLARRSVDLYRAVHGGIAQAIQATGLIAERRGSFVQNPPPERTFLCFADRDAEDLTVRGFKIVGSAQRRRRGAVLQHGSLLLAGSELTAELPGLAELGGHFEDPVDWSARLATAIPSALGLHARNDALTDIERELAAQLERDVYRNPVWTRKR